MLLLQQTHIKCHVDLTQQQFGGVADHHDRLAYLLRHFLFVFHANEIIQSPSLKKSVCHAHDAPEWRYKLMRN